MISAPDDLRLDRDDSYATVQVKYFARRLASRLALDRHELEDIEQELRFHLHAQARKFDSTRSGAKTFVQRVLSNKSTSLQRMQLAHKRGAGRRCQSLSDLLGQGGRQGANGDVIAQRQGRAHRRIDSRPDVHQLQLDVASAASRLSDEQQRICALLADCPQQKIAAKLGLTKGALRRQLGFIRQEFSAMGLEAYLNNSQSGGR